MHFNTEDGPLDFTPRRAIVAGWTGRDVAAVNHHIEELAAIGVPAPSTTPLYYRVSAALVTQAPAIETVGETSSGEVEPVLFMAGGRIWLTVGSDQTDRALEAHSVALSKQICAKPVAGAAWPWDGIGAPDRLELRAWAGDAAADTLYQEGTFAAIRPLAELIAGAGMAEGDIMFCGTLPAIGGVRPARCFRMELRDPATGHAISHAYETRALPVIA